MEKKHLTSREKPVEFSTPKEEQLPPQMIIPMNTGSNQNEWVQKVWGKTRLVSHTPQRAVHELILNTPGSFCSIHYHEKRDNIFVVLSGMVEVTEKRPGGELSRLLYHGIAHSVSAGVIHQFKTITKDTHLLEIYLPVGADDVDEEDIVRQHEGGLVGQPITPGSRFLVAAES